jgi:hypothetical protein
MRRAARLMALLIGCLVLQTSVMAQPSRNADDKRNLYRHDRTGVEYLTWVFTERTRVQFDVRGTPDRAADVNAALEGIITAARIP